VVEKQIKNWLQIEQWIKDEGGQTPMLAVGFSQSVLKNLVSQLRQWLIDQKIASAADIVLCQTDEATLAIKQVREIVARLAFKSVSSRRLVVIEQVEKMSVPAANALLKSLEEAPAACRYLLTTQWRTRLLPTVLSRCITVSVDNNQVEGREDMSRAEDIMKQSVMGRVGRAGDLKEEEITQLVQYLSEVLRERGPNPELRLAMMRIVDYYRVKGINGNEKLAKEVLMASLPASS